MNALQFHQAGFGSVDSIKEMAGAEILESLFGEGNLATKWARLGEIYNKCEKCWWKTVHSCPEQKIKYLLIGEAPPWSEAGRIEYFYNPETPIGPYLRAVTKALVVDGVLKREGAGAALAQLRQKGFLLCDSIPFALNYSKPYKRNNRKYEELVADTFRTYLQSKLSTEETPWANDVKVAFALKKNAEAILESYSMIQLARSGLTIPIDERLIAVDESNYPSAEKLMQIFEA